MLTAGGLVSVKLRRGGEAVTGPQVGWREVFDCHEGDSSHVSNRCHASSNRCLTSSNKKLILFAFVMPADVLAGDSSEIPTNCHDLDGQVA